MQDKPEFAAICHCGNVKLVASETPSSLTRCNCSICDRLGAMWAYFDAARVTLHTGDIALQSYAWGKKTNSYQRCGQCGCTTHYTRIQSNGNEMIAINARMAAPGAIDGIPVREFDGRSTWKFLNE